VGISQNSNTTPSLSAAADLTPWLCELNEQVDGALADLAHTMQSVQSGTYARDANGQSFGLVQANFLPDMAELWRGSRQPEDKILRAHFTAVQAIPMDAEIGQRAGAFFEAVR
jgi:hypothetical protein